MDAQSPIEHGARGFLVHVGDSYVGKCEGGVGSYAFGGLREEVCSINGQGGEG